MRRKDLIQNPEFFQGSLKKREYFEGWYFKQVSDHKDYALALIPGVSLNSGDRHAFIQVIVGPDHQTHYFRYPLEAFGCDEDVFKLYIGNNTFSKSGIEIDLENDDLTLKGKLSFKYIESLKGKPIMGPFSHFSFLECYHGVVSMNHLVSGQVMHNDQDIRFTKSKGYIEKDWGISFPKRYIWIQANQFLETQTSLVFSLADIPLKIFTFKGFLCNLIYHGEEYRFATYTGARINKLKAYAGGLYLQLTSKDLILEIWAKNVDNGTLKAPVRGRMDGVVKEGISSKVRIRLSRAGLPLFEDTSDYCGMERYRDDKFLELWRDR